MVLVPCAGRVTGRRDAAIRRDSASTRGGQAGGGRGRRGPTARGGATGVTATSLRARPSQQGRRALHSFTHSAARCVAEWLARPTAV